MLKTLNESNEGNQNSQSSQTQNEFCFSNVLERELGIEGSLNLRAANIPRLNDCKTPEEIVALNHKLVRFDCMIQDQFEEEFYLSYLNVKDQEGSKQKGTVYKYFSELTDEDMKKYELQPDPHSNQQFMFERGNVLGVSVPNLNDWVDQTLKSGSPSIDGQK